MISDGKKYTSEDLAKISCDNCENCSACCKFTDDTIFLDPWDMYMLKKVVSDSFDDLMKKGSIGLTLADGVVTPYLGKDKNTKACVFLNERGRCSIHDNRPGFCRMFPLGRVFEDDGTFKYFNQIYECPYPNKSKIKIKTFLGIDRLKTYEEFVVIWHGIQKNLSEFVMQSDDEELIKQLNMKMLTIFFINPYDTSDDFYPQFEARIKEYTGQ